MGHGVIGAANAHNCTAVVTFILQFGYCRYCPDIKEAWYWPSLKIFRGLSDYLWLAIPGTLMLFFENLSMQALVLMAGATGDVNALAAQVLVVSIGELLLTFPYGLSLSAAAFVGNAMGARRPALAKSNSRIFFVFSAFIALAVCLTLSHYRHSIITLYGATLEVRNLADPTIRVFAIVFFCDWVQCSLGGIIKGVG